MPPLKLTVDEYQDDRYQYVGAYPQKEKLGGWETSGSVEPGRAYAGDAITIVWKVDWPDLWVECQRMKAKVDVINRNTGNSISGYPKEVPNDCNGDCCWYEWNVDKGASHSFIMPSAPVDIHIDIYHYREHSGDMWVDDFDLGVQYLGDGGNGGNGGNGGGDEAPELPEWLTQKYYGVPGWGLVGIGIGGLIIASEV